MGGRESEQLHYLKIRSAAGADEQSTFSDPYGGYLVPIGFSPTMLQVDPEADPTMGRTTQVPMSVPQLSIPARVDKDHSSSVSGGLRVYRRAEADTVTASRMQMELISLRANPLMGLSYASEELLSDSPTSFVAIISAGFKDEFDSKVLDERLNGTRVGEFLGLMKSPALISVTRAVANEISYVDILTMMSRCWGYRNAVWLCNHDTIPQLGQLNLQVGAGGSAIFVQSATQEIPSILMGKPLFFSEYLQTLGTVGDMLCVNWSQYLEATYQPLQSAESIHVRFAQNERAFRFTMRNDGAPWWRSPLTPRHSANTLSPYVALAT
jgi:HK97 family phage major capsid protein